MAVLSVSWNMEIYIILTLEFTVDLHATSQNQKLEQNPLTMVLKFYVIWQRDIKGTWHCCKDVITTMCLLQVIGTAGNSISYKIFKFEYKTTKICCWRFSFLHHHCVKSVHIRSYSGPLFHAFRLNAKRYGVSLRIQSECRKIQTKITPNTDTFYAVVSLNSWPFFKYVVYDCSSEVKRSSVQFLQLKLAKVDPDLT